MPKHRDYVGSTDEYDLMAATQFNALTTMGLRDTHRILDIGCGSLRLGRLLIPYLRKGRYFGIEPAVNMLQSGIQEDLGQEIIDLKEARFIHTQDFDPSGFEVPLKTFHYMIAQSVFIHTGLYLFQSAINNLRPYLTDNGLLFFNIKAGFEAGWNAESSDWHYPHTVVHTPASIEKSLDDAGYVWQRIPWHHPRSPWYLAANSERWLFREKELAALEQASRFLRNDRGFMKETPRFSDKN